MIGGLTSVQTLAFPDRPSMRPANNDGFAENTNSQLYMWESINQRDMPDFENDIIASTDEVAYTKAVFKQDQHPLFDTSYINEDVLKQDESLLIFGQNEQDQDDLELSLDMADFLREDHEQPAAQLQEARLNDTDAEVFVGERAEMCSICGEEAEEDIGLEKTTIGNISYLPDPEHSTSVHPFDQTLDNLEMS